MLVVTDVRGRQSMIGGLHVEVLGDDDAPALLFSAGLGGIGRYWTPQLAAFADYRIILYDHRGTGQSDRSALPRPYTARHMASDLGMILDGLGIASAHVVGHAAGGVAGLELARTAADRVASLTVVNGWASADPHFLRCFQIRRDLYQTRGVEAYLMAQPLFLYPAEWISNNLAMLDAERAHQAAGFQDGETLLARMNCLEAFDIRQHLADIHVPTLIVATEDDMLVPAHASQALAEGLPRARRVSLPRGGHAVNVTAPDSFDEALRAFLTALPVPAAA